MKKRNFDISLRKGYMQNEIDYSLNFYRYDSLNDKGMGIS
ncbi:hypothetical protein SBF1_5380002 [Candidatus Desulfosporosinus infrequens]|uniref:Uncharacterized protein n=1 Tax=Candidatus Desulfosporosinus infrequens TaxID=2043169 RepID=A0A2U3LJ13_9FIRM|nr:hypothetical protein SBF1_5380002 [Candidatus Desulfosporosinus infrequens]